MDICTSQKKRNLDSIRKRLALNGVITITEYTPMTSEDEEEDYELKLERLQRHRTTLLDTIDVTMVIKTLKTCSCFHQSDEEDIMQEPSRRSRTAGLLEWVEQRGLPAMDRFLDAIADVYPHLHFLLCDDEEDEAEEECTGVGDPWQPIREARAYFMTELDAAEFIPYLPPGVLLSEQQRRYVMAPKDPSRRTKILLDIVETLEPGSVQLFLDTLSETHPHVYLAVTESREHMDDML